MRVYYQDTDAGGVVFHAAYLHFFERARTEWMRSCGFAPNELVSRYRVLFIVRKLEIAYLRPALLDDLVTVSAALEKMGHAQLTFAQQVRRDGETLVRAAVNVACVAADSLKPAAFPQPIRASLTQDTVPAANASTRSGQPRRHLNRV